MDEYFNISLSDLTKQSARQLCYLRSKKKTNFTAPNFNKYPLKVLNDKNISVYNKMRGSFHFDEFLRINYTFDKIKVNDVSAELIEHRKSFKGEMWYFESCILKVAAYEAFTKKNPYKILQTASFHLEKENPLELLNITGLYLRSVLHIDGKKYSIVVPNAEKIVKFYIEKAIASIKYDTAKKFDTEFKHKEFEKLSDCFIYRSLNNESKKEKA